jgi:hypothetical protein
MRKIFAALVLVALSVSANAASISVHTNRADFMTIVGTATVEDFTETYHFPITSGSLNQYTSEAGLNPGDIEAGVTYSTSLGTGNFFNIDAGGGYSGGFLDSVTGDHDLTITFDSAVGSFGFDTNYLMGADFDITINFLSGSSYSENFLVSSGRSMEFFGFGSINTDIESVVINGGGYGSFNFALDNFTFSTTSLVPIPAAVWLFGSALAGLGWMRRK